MSYENCSSNYFIKVARILLLFLPTLVMSIDSKDFKLELIQVLFRHGARTCSPLEIQIAMPEYADNEFQNKFGDGQLTTLGKKQAYRLGQALRARYDDFLGTAYQPNEVYACTSDQDRTKMTLQLVLAGLFPPRGEQIWMPSLPWQPIPYHYQHAKSDVFFKSFEKSKYITLLDRARKLSFVRQKEEKSLNLKEYFETKGIHAIHNYGILGSFAIFNVLYSLKASDAKIPIWFTDGLLDILRDITTDYLDIMSMTTELMKLNVGVIVKTMVDNLNVDENKKNPRKIYLYSGHDHNLAGLARAHKTDQLRYPTFGSAIILEKLRNSKNELHIRLMQWTQEDGTFVPINLCNYEDTCPIQEYLKILQNIIPSEKEIESMINDERVDFSQMLVSNVQY